MYVGGTPPGGDRTERLDRTMSQASSTGAIEEPHRVVRPPTYIAFIISATPPQTLSPDLGAIRPVATPAGEVVVVLGMHRSGTSAVAGRSLRPARGRVSLRADATPSAEPVRLFEPTSTAAAVDAVLHELGGTWSSPPVDNLHASPSILIGWFSSLISMSRPGRRRARCLSSRIRVSVSSHHNWPGLEDSAKVIFSSGIRSR